MNINWFLNLNRALDLNPSNLFYSNQIVSNNNLVVVTANQFTYVIDIKTGNTLSILKIDKNKISRPSVLNQNLFIITDNSIIKLN